VPRTRKRRRRATCCGGNGNDASNRAALVPTRAITIVTLPAEPAKKCECASSDAQHLLHNDHVCSFAGFHIKLLRAKAGTDKADATDMREAQQQLGHKSVKTTEIYLRTRAGEKVTPTK
jgi:hypothetical protein